MNAASDTASPLRLRGAPLGLAVVVPITPITPAADAASSQGTRLPETNAIALSVAAPAGKSARRKAAPPVDASVTIAETTPGTAILRLDVPRATPPGTYEGRVRVGDQERAIVVDVDPSVYVRLYPVRLVLTAEPGASVDLTLTIVNEGNVAAEIRGAYVIGLYDVGGVERAVGKTFVAELSEGERRVDRFVDELAGGHGGLVRVRIGAGSGDLAPGEVRELGVQLAIPDRLEPGRTYWGTWALHNLRYYVRITGAERRKRKEAPR